MARVASDDYHLMLKFRKRKPVPRPGPSYDEDMGARITGRKRQRVINRCGRKCYLCGIKCVEYKGQNTGHQPDDALTIDHVLAVALGGTDDESNLAVACALCNGCKDDLPPGDEKGLELLRLKLLYGIAL